MRNPLEAIGDMIARERKRSKAADDEWLKQYSRIGEFLMVNQSTWWRAFEIIESIPEIPVHRHHQALDLLVESGIIAKY